MRSVFLEAEKLDNPASGLGQFCDHLLKAILLEDLSGLDATIYLPSRFVGDYGEAVNYLRHNDLHKIIRPFKNSFDVWHCLHQDSSFLPGKKSKLILTIHDMNFLQKYDGKKREKRRTELQDKVDRADVLVAISKYTKDQLTEELDLRGKRVEVIYNGLTIDPSSVDDGSISVENPFLFFIGGISERKNVASLIPMMKYLPDLHLVVAGDKNSAYADKVLSETSRLGLTNRVVFTGRISESQRVSLYRNCVGLVFPSLAEGFGLPVIEAMSFGKPVFLSRHGSLPEIGNVHARYFDDFDPERMARIVIEGLRDFNSGLWRSEDLMRYALSFSWKSAAKRYIELYRNC